MAVTGEGKKGEGRKEGSREKYIMQQRQQKRKQETIIMNNLAIFDIILYTCKENLSLCHLTTPEKMLVAGNSTFLWNVCLLINN